jgi:hypothetical protein
MTVAIVQYSVLSIKPAHIHRIGNMMMTFDSINDISKFIIGTKEILSKN